MRILLTLLVVTSLSSFAATPEYLTGKLVDLRSHSTGSGAMRSQYSFCLAVEVDDMSYLLDYEPYGRWAYKPTEMIIGDPIKLRINKDHMYIAKPKEGEFKARIVRRQRRSRDMKPITCAMPVAVE